MVSSSLYSCMLYRSCLKVDKMFFLLAYSVYAFMAEDITGMFKNGFIRYWDDVFGVLRVYIEMEGGSVNENDEITFPPGLSSSYLLSHSEELIQCIEV
jgi:hypothetical protein